jgi:alpha-glucosidase (family GH31 glycosyl hydrolase)
MPQSEILEWYNAKTRFDASRVALDNLVQAADQMATRIRLDWRDVWTKGIGFTNTYQRGKHEFDPATWPDGATVKQALDECHQANQSLIAAYNRLIPQERHVLNIPVAPH